MLMVRTLTEIPSKRGTIAAGTVLTISETTLAKLQGRVQPLAIESSASCQIIGEVCRISYSPELYEQHRARDGDTIDGCTFNIVSI